MYEPRTYRHWIKDRGLVSFTAVVRETDLYIRAANNLEQIAVESIIRHRTPLEKYIEAHPFFRCTLEPWEPSVEAPAIVKEMAVAAKAAGVGPMAAVAGAIAEAVGNDLLAHSPEVIVENGGDIFMKITQKRLIGVYAGNRSPFTGKIALEIDPDNTPLGICTSSGTVGPSLSFGESDAVIILSASAALADAWATAIGNRVKTIDDVEIVVDRVKDIKGITGVVIIKDDRIGLWGTVKLVPVT
jgi:ApbE superfamily uncharacterized protein (UPF0280 family)